MNAEGDDAGSGEVRRAWMWMAASIGALLAGKVGSTDAGVTADGCPGLAAHLTLNDYDGTHTAQLCVAPEGFSISGGVLTLHLYDAASDGIFHYGFDAAD